jgi:hypothetical protein
MSKVAPPASVFEAERRNFHRTLVDTRVLRIDDANVVSVADKSSRMSVEIAGLIYKQVTEEIKTTARLVGQTSGQEFEQLCRDYLRRTFLRLSHLRPGSWHVEGATARGIGMFEQYQHLVQLDEATKGNADLAAALGTDYLIKPDVLIYRDPEPEERINNDKDGSDALVDADIARRSVLRKINNTSPILHASVSTKWTLRSDRAQNARTEALNLLRNRKGQVPHIVVVTGEPLPSRLASLALGTGDIDCVYHAFLPELMQAVGDIVKQSQKQGQDRGEDSLEMLEVMTRGRRLKDIADLPLDLAV